MAHGSTKASLGLLILRLGAGSFLIYGHGWGKLANYAERSHTVSDPFQKKELALLYLVVFAAIALIGAGRFSLDAQLGHLWSRKRAH